MAKKTNSHSPKTRKKYLSQTDVPSVGITEALRVADALKENYGYQPTAPLHVAKALDIQPQSGGFRMLTGASVAYGITIGASNASEISLTDLGRRIVRSPKENDELAAKREAFLRPRIIEEFLKHYDGSPIPRKDIGKNVLMEMGVPESKTDRVWDLIMNDARALGLIEEIKNRSYVHLAGVQSPPETEQELGENGKEDSFKEDDYPDASEAEPDSSVQSATALRVFISHGKNMEIVEQVETMLGMADLEYEIAVADETPAIPVSEKVFTAMRKCNAAVIVVSVEESPNAGNSTYAINQNVLIEIGAAFVLYDRKVVLVWDKRLTVPSNLQGLYRCEFEGNELSWKTGIKLMQAIKKFRR